MLEKIMNRLRKLFCEELIEENRRLVEQLKTVEERLNQSHEVSRKDQIKKILQFDLNEKNVILIDFENITMIPEFVLKDRNSVCYIFVGPTVIKRAETLIRELIFNGRHVLMPIERSGRNQLDTCLSFLLGQIVSVYEPAQITLISNDSDYDNLKGLMSKGNIPYKQMEYRDIRSIDRKTVDDNFLIRYMEQYIRVFPETECSRKLFMNRLRTCKPHLLQHPEVQSMLHRLRDLGYIEERIVNGKSRIRIMKEKIQV